SDLLHERFSLILIFGSHSSFHLGHSFEFAFPCIPRALRSRLGFLGRSGVLFPLCALPGHFLGFLSATKLLLSCLQSGLGTVAFRFGFLLKHIRIFLQRGRLLERPLQLLAQALFLLPRLLSLSVSFGRLDLEGLGSGGLPALLCDEDLLALV